MKPVFKSDAAIEQMTEWYERFRARIVVPTEIRTVPTTFGETHVLVGGPANAPSLVMVHGAMASSAHMMVELGPLLHTYRVYAVDVIGQSVKTPHARPSVANNDYGAWLAQVLDGLGLARTAVVAVSWGGFAAVRLALPLLKYRMFGGDKRFAVLANNLLTTTDDDWLPYLRTAFDSFNMDMRVPKLATVDELAAFRAPTFVVAGDSDYSIPGEKLIARAKQLFPALAGTELVPNCKHCPPTTDTFRQWLSEKIAGFLAAGDSTAAAG